MRAGRHCPLRRGCNHSAGGGGIRDCERIESVIARGLNRALRADEIVHCKPTESVTASGLNRGLREARFSCSAASPAQCERGRAAGAGSGGSTVRAEIESWIASGLKQ